jgi:hypothetical protein
MTENIFTPHTDEQTGPQAEPHVAPHLEPPKGGALVEGPNSFAATGFLDGMRKCPPTGGNVFAKFNAKGAVYKDDEQSFSTVEPAIDLTASSFLMFAWRTASRPAVLIPSLDISPASGQRGLKTWSSFVSSCLSGSNPRSCELDRAAESLPSSRRDPETCLYQVLLIGIRARWVMVSDSHAELPRAFILDA